jgi:hypothetical protein
VESEIETISPNYHRLRTRTAMFNEFCCLVVLGRQQSARERERDENDENDECAKKQDFQHAIY